MTDPQTPDPQLLQRAVDDREAHPWRYYRFDAEELKKWLEKQAAEVTRLTQENEKLAKQVATYDREFEFLSERTAKAEADLLVCQQERDKASEIAIGFREEWYALQQGIAQVIEAIREIPHATESIYRGAAFEWAETLSRLIAPKDEEHDDEKNHAR